MSQQTLSFEQTKPFRHKVTAAWLSLLLGVVGAQHRYLGRRFWYVPLMFTSLAILGTLVFQQGLDSLFPNLLILPVSAGIIEAVILALRSPEKFDALYNPQSEQTQSAWLAQRPDSGGLDGCLCQYQPVLAGTHHHGLLSLYGLAGSVCVLNTSSAL